MDEIQTGQQPGNGGTPPWFDGIKPEDAGFGDLTEFKGYLQNRGWDKVDPKVAFAGAVKAHRAAEQHLGVPPDQIVRLPKDASDQQGWQTFRTKTGVPADTKGYDFSTVKFADGAALDQPFVDTISKALLEANVSKTAAPGVVASVVKFMEAAEAEETAKYNAQLAVERDKLAQNWGSKANANLVVAQNAIKALNIDPQSIATLEKGLGYAGVMEMFRNIGARIGEDRFVVSQAPGANGTVMTREQATDTLKQRMNDGDWVNKLNNGDFTVRQEFDNLTRIKTFG